MKISKMLLIGLSSIVAVLSVSCASDAPDEMSPDGPTSKHGAIGWNRPLPGEGQGALGGFGSR